jgi:two-component system cell cycle response regulator
MTGLVLIIEDDESMANLEKRYLEKDGFMVLVANSGRSGLDILSNNTSPDLLIIDYRLPDMSGVDVMRKVRGEFGKSIPSIIVTGGGDENVAVRAMKLGALDYIVKDRDTIRHLPATCREVLKKFNLAEENLRLMDELKRVNAELVVANEKLDELSKGDDLTKIYNRRHLMETLRFEIGKALRYRTPLSFAIFDLDHFKSVNDTYGHSTGDLVLKQFSELLMGRLRRTDVLGRYGGEEFAIALTGTPLSKALSICDELRELVSQIPFGNEGSIEITTSAGVACLADGMSHEVLIDVADRSLYRAKEFGRNRVVAIQELA